MIRPERRASLPRVQDDPAKLDQLPTLAMQAVIVPGDQTQEGTLVQAVAIPWFQVVPLLVGNPDRLHELDWRKWEEIVAGAYEAEGWKVILTPRSGDRGRDVIATSKGLGSIRILEQVKCYKPGHLVTADEVRSMLGVLAANSNASKGIVTTTSSFAPGIEKDTGIAMFMPYRLELKPRDKLLSWLSDIAYRRGPK